MTINDLAEIYDGPHATPTRRDAGPYFLNIASLKQGRLDLGESDHVSEVDYERWTRRVTPEAGDILFSYETRLGSAALMPSDLRACLGRRMALLRPRPGEIDSRYLLYRYIAPDFQDLVQQKAIHGATVDRIALSTMGEWSLCIHDRWEQRAIAEVLGALDDKIAANDRAARLCEEYVHAVADQILIESHGVEPFLGEVGVTFGEAFKGSQFSPPSTGRPLIRIRDLKTHTPQTWTVEARPGETVIHPGEVIVGMDAEFSPAWWLGQPGLLNQRVMRLSSEFLGNGLLKPVVEGTLKRIESAKTGTTVAHLNKSDLSVETLPRLNEKLVKRWRSRVRQPSIVASHSRMKVSARRS
ncbi:MAG: hypothetical protein M9891_14155 [Austwickia sp.]|nr:hypothetical protein [Austwickia sp.]